MTSPWLTLIGIGDDGALLPAAEAELAKATVVFGSDRHFQLCGKRIAGEKRHWPSPFSSVYADLETLRGRSVAVLATGDPQWYGIGSALAPHITAEEMRVLPSPSAFQLAAAHLRWSLQTVTCLSLHGRAVETLNGFLQPGRKILALTSNSETPAQVAKLLCAAGFGNSCMTVLDHMGGEKECMTQATASLWTATTSDFNTLALELVASDPARVFARSAGLPDSAFHHDGKMTKREVRAVTLAALAPMPGQLLWDIGAGCGSIGIEWMRADMNAKAIGLEPNTERRAFARENALALGTPGLDLRDVSAPDGLADLPDPDAVFIGGGLTSPDVVAICHERLKPGGRLVANAVTLEGETILLKAFEDLGGELVRLSVQRADPVGRLTGWRPMMPVTQWQLTKPFEVSQ